MENRSHLLRALKVLFPNKSSYRIKQSDIPLILYSFECYRRGIKEVRLTTKNVLFKRYFRTGKRNVIQISKNQRFAWKKIMPLVYMAGYLKKKYELRSSVDLFLLSLLLDIRPTLLLVGLSKFQKNKRLSKLSAEGIAGEWIKNYQDAELFLKKENLRETIMALKLKRGTEWRKLFLKIDGALKELPDSELIAGLTHYFVNKSGAPKKRYKLEEEDIFYFDTLYQLLELGNIRSPINLKRVSITDELSREVISITGYILKRALEKGIKPTALFFYYVIPGNMPHSVKAFFNRIENPFSKRKVMWQFLYIRNKTPTHNIDADSYLPTSVRDYLDERINLAGNWISEKLKKIDMKTFEMDNNR